jgi:hypothetical protein
MSVAVSKWYFRGHVFGSYVFAADALDNVIWGSAQQLCDDGKLVHVVLAGEKRLALQHLCKNAACAPNVDLDVVFLPREHNFRRAIVPCRDVTRHLGVLYTGEAEVADLQIAVLVDQNIARLQIAVDDSGGVDVFQSALGKLADPCHCRFATYQDLVQEVLNKLLLEGSRGEQTVEIGAQELGDKVAKESVGIGVWRGRRVHVLERRNEDVAQADDLRPVRMAMRRSGDHMPTFSCLRCLSSFNSRYVRFERTGVLKGFMIFLIATAWLVSWSLAELPCISVLSARARTRILPDETERAHAHGLQVGVSVRASVRREAQRGGGGVCHTCSLSQTSCQRSARGRILPSWWTGRVRRRV